MDDEIVWKYGDEDDDDDRVHDDDEEGHEDSQIREIYRPIIDFVEEHADYIDCEYDTLKQSIRIPGRHSTEARWAAEILEKVSESVCETNTKEVQRLYAQIRSIESTFLASRVCRKHTNLIRFHIAFSYPPSCADVLIATGQATHVDREASSARAPMGRIVQEEDDVDDCASTSGEDRCRLLDLYLKNILRIFREILTTLETYYHRANSTLEQCISGIWMEEETAEDVIGSALQAVDIWNDVKEYFWVTTKKVQRLYRRILLVESTFLALRVCFTHTNLTRVQFFFHLFLQARHAQ